MNFIQRKSSWTNLELWLFKLTVFFCGILAGVYFHQALGNFTGLFLTLAAIGCAYTLAIWFKKQHWR